MVEKNYHMTIDLTLSIINGKWKSLILCHLGDGSQRNGELLRKIPDISQKVLTQQLKELINDKVVKKTNYPGLPLHVEYSLTKEGRSLRQVLIDMSAWGEEHARKLAQDGQKISFTTDNYLGYLRIKEPQKDINQRLAE
ncbi:winged helix-turn-helix transcriptional regulator [Companilactobacillus halodurans]|uniref:Helix-turn-helix transcriptional regulator n=1 Tax=Companilactobacillus halodurans TaxID=2584183 RepID=A0A5P0ZNU9_9LACO|nr:helix-turn-helix domain-containing protein [Companilactobacillus halodurans]MQS75511.1 helix-turn-helix transcriptional regulator [Companilactobacillus halodurans]MQS97755.1 helix-turn-helix transcriptional regulator [Companilactobacillus halodurans]